MPLVDEQDLLDHAGSCGYGMCAFEVAGAELLAAAIDAAERARAPLILALSAQRLDHLDAAQFLPAMEAAAQAASVPVVVRFADVAAVESAVRAVGLGCNSIVSAAPDGTFDHAALVSGLAELTEACGVSVLLAAEAVRAERLDGVATIWLREAMQGDPAAAGDHLALMTGVRRRVCAEAERLIRAAGGAGQADAALAACRPWAPVEHVILFNSLPEGEEGVTLARDLMRDGRDILGAIPGVRQVFVGNALRPDARYRHCWLVRFVHPRVIDSYRDHPDHVAFADERFRPAAPDRVSIDFEES